VCPEVLVELFDVNQLLTYEQAARQAGVSVPTVRMWKNRGHLRVAQDPHGRDIYVGRSPRFRLLDVAKAEHATRQAARRRPLVPA
jgi:excisionase family DNA binding protein